MIGLMRFFWFVSFFCGALLMGGGASTHSLSDFVWGLSIFVATVAAAPWVWSREE